MRTILDNATVTAALRALGAHGSLNRDLFDLDVAALRVLVDAVCLSKEVVIVDNYVSEYAEDRRKILMYPGVRFEAMPEGIEKRARKAATAHVVNWRLHKKLALDFSGLLAEMEILFRHAWHGSESFLVLKALGVENKYQSEIVEALIAEAPRAYTAKELEKVRPKHLNREAMRVAQAVSWAAIRSVYYRCAASYFGGEYQPHPIRNAFNLKCILFDNHPDTRKTKLPSPERRFDGQKTRSEIWLDVLRMDEQGRKYHEDMNGFLSTFWQDQVVADSNVFGVTTHDIQMPPFLAYALHRMPDGLSWSAKRFLDTLFEIREDKGLADLRQQLEYVYFEVSQSERQGALRSFSHELAALRKYLQVYLGFDRERVAIDLKVVEYEVSVPRFLTKPLYPHRPRLAFLRDVLLELAAVSAMGRQHDLLYQKVSGRHG